MRWKKHQPGGMPPLNWLRAFEAVARHSSFKLAAEELNVTSAAISQQVRSLEEFYDVKLFVRLTRALELTRLGKLAAPLMSKALESFKEACDVIKNDVHREWLTLTAPFTFCMKWLMPQLERFNEQYPNIEIRINATDDLLDLNQGEADIGIRYGDGNYPNLDVENLMTGSYCLVASPDLFEKSESIKNVSELAQYAFLHTDWRGSSNFVPNWDMWLKAAGIPTNVAKKGRGHKFSNEMMTINAAVSGLGVALVSYANAIDDLKSGKLLKLFEDVQFRSSNFDYYIVRPSSGDSSSVAAILHAWLCKQAKEEKYI